MKITTEFVKTPNIDMAIEIGKLMPDLSNTYKNNPISLDVLKQLANDPQKALIVAKVNNKVVGCAVLNIITTLHKPKAWLEDFVVSSDKAIRGKGAGYAIWQEIVKWLVERNVSLEFTSAEQRRDAHKFYKKQGAKIKDTCVFLFEPN